MSRIEGRQHVQATQDFSSNKTSAASDAGSGAQSKSAYLANNDSPHDKFCAHEGIDRGRGCGHDLHGKRKGDKVEIEDEDGKRTLAGTVLKDTGDTLEVLVGNQMYKVRKDNGRAESHREATDEEMQEYAQIQQEQAEQARIQEQQSARVDESIKQDNKKHDTQLYNQKTEVRLDDSKKIETKKKAVQSLADQFQFQTPQTEHQTLTVGQIILSKDKEAEFKKTKLS